MINYDSLTLKLFCSGNAEYFEGARIQKVQQPSRYELIIVMRSKGVSKKLYINFHPNFCHICFTSPETEKRRGIKNPKSALMFCMLLRKYLQNSKITRVSVPEYERIFEIYFEYYNEFNEKSELCLAAELMGKYSNVILYNYDNNVIIGCAHNISAEKSRKRELCGRLPYILPEKQHKKDLLKTDFEEFKKSIDLNNLPKSVSAGFYYLTSSIVQDTEALIKPFDLKMLYEKLCFILKDNSPCIRNDYSKYYVSSFPDCFKCSDINEMTDKYFSFHQEQHLKTQLKSKIIKHINAQLSKLNNLKIKQKEQLARLDEAQEYKNKADILKVNLYCLKAGEKSAVLYDFEGTETVIALDENKSPAENAEKYYNLYKKAKSAYEYAEAMLKETKSEILYYEEMKYFADNTETIEDLESLLSEIMEEKPAEGGGDKTISGIECIEFKGFKIYAGKNKKQNDYILSRLSNSEDLWFHPLNAAGAHIIVKTDKKEAPEDVILKAAQITKEYSMQKNNSKTAVIYTKRKYVKKAARKQAFVTYKNETEIVV